MDIFDIKTEEDYLKNKDLIDINFKNNCGENALFDFGCQIEKIQWLIKYGIDVTNKNEVNKNCLCFHGWNFEKFKILVDAGADIHNIDAIGRNILFYVTSAKILDYLLKNNVNFNVKSGRFDQNFMEHYVLEYESDPEQDFEFFKVIVDNNITIPTEVIEEMQEACKIKVLAYVEKLFLSDNLKNTTPNIKNTKRL